MKFLPDYKCNFKILKKGRISLIVSGLLVSMASASDISQTIQVHQSSKGTTAQLSHNGTPMVNIATPKSSGLSKNYYDLFNVDNRGLVLNNMQKVGQTQLAGYELSNPNLLTSGGAKVILNEVLSTNKSSLNGYIEVGGSKASVIIANPNGISVNGAGFINVNRASIVAGSSVLNSTQDAISGFAIGNNKLEIQGDGLDGKETTSLDLVAKNISLDGQVNATILNLIGGVTSYDYENNSGTTTDTTEATTYAIDASMLGGMYANLITIKATNAGLGVKISSESGALAGGFSIDSAGKVLIDGAVSATDGTMSIKANEIALQKANITSNTDTKLDGTTVNVDGGNIKATNNLTITATTLNDTKDTTNTDTDTNKRGASKIDIKSTNATIATDYTADTLAIDTATLDNSGKLYSTNDMTIKSTSTIVSSGDIISDKTINITANDMTNSGSIKNDTATITAKDIINSGTIVGNVLTFDIDTLQNDNEIYTTTGDLTITADGITNNKILKSANDILLDTASYTNGQATSQISANSIAFNNLSSFTNAGLVYTTKDILLQNLSSINNSGTINSQDNITMKATDITSGDNSKVIAKNNITIEGTNTLSLGDISNEGDISLTTNNTFTNKKTIKSLKALTVSANSIVNEGDLASDTTITLQNLKSLNNSGTIANGSGDMLLQNLDTINNSGTISSQDNITMKATDIISGDNSKIIAKNNITIEGTNALSLGNISNEGDISLTTSNTFTNKKTIKSLKALTVSANSIVNEGDLGSATTITLQNLKSLTNSGKIINGSGDILLQGLDTLNNSGLILSENDLNINAKVFTNTKDINSKKNISITSATTFTNSGDILNDDGDITLTVATTNNSANIVSANDLTIVSTGTIDNSGLILGTNDLDISGATTITNTSTGAFVANNMLKMGATTISNAGTLYSDKDMELNANLTNTSTLLSGGGITATSLLTTTGDLTNSGDIWANDATMSGDKYENSGTFVVYNDATMSYTTSWKNTKDVSIGHDATITTAEFTNGSGVVDGEVINLGMQDFTKLSTNTSGDTPTPSMIIYYGYTMTGAYVSADTYANLIKLITQPMSYPNGSTLTYADIYNDPTNPANYGWLMNSARFTHINNYSYYPNKFTSGTDLLGHYISNEAGVFHTGYIQGPYDHPTEKLIMKIGYDPASGASTDIANLKANGTMNINFTNGKNDGSVMNADTINLVGTGTFTNKSTPSGYKLITYTGEYECGMGCDLDLITNVDVQTFAGTSSGGGVIKANTLNATGFNLVNEAYENVFIGNGGAKKSSDKTVQNTTISNSTLATPTVSSSNVSAPTLQDVATLNISLPTNPNGKYVVSKNPNSKFLVESNPIYGEKAKYLGSDYLMKALGIDMTDTSIKLLGDASFEAKMIEKQITEKTGSALLKGMNDAGSQIKSMYDNAAKEAGALGLKFGEAPSMEQLANLKTDMIWMVKTVVNGVEVLAPQVYLAQTTIDALNMESGTISATNANMDLKSLTNTGGTIEGKENLNITSKGDITNTAGNIKGGNVSLESTQGSIVNQSLTKEVIGANGIDTQLSQTGSISSTNNMNLKAKEDITIKGANVNAGNNLNVDAGGGLNVQAIETRKDGTMGGYSTDFASSNISSGNDMKLSSQKDMNIEASNVKAGGNLDMQTQGNLNIVAKDAKTLEQEVKNGGLHKTTTTTNKGSTIESGKNMNLKATNDITVQGSNVNAGENLNTNATNINILEGHNTKEEEVITTTTESTKTKKSGGMLNGDKKTTTDVTTTKSEKTNESNSVASKLTSGKDMNLKATNNVLIKGSELNSGGDMNIEATNTTIKGAENTKTTTSTTNISSSTSSSQAGFTAGYQKSSEDKNTLIQTTDIESKNAGSVLKSGGNMNLKATNDVTVQGSKTEAGKDLNMEGTNVNVLAGKDTKSTTTTTDTKTKSMNFGVGFGGVEFGMDFGKEKSKEQADSSNAKVSTTTAGEDMSKKATNKITDEGTQIKAGGDYTQEANTIENKAAQSTSSYSKTTDTQNIGFGVGLTTSATIKGSVNFEQGTDKFSEQSSTATVSNIEAGGNVKSKSSGTTSMEGTNISAGKDMNIEAGNLEIKQATDTYKSSESSNGFNVGVGAEVGSSGLKGANIGFGIHNSNEKTETTTAQTSNLSSGGNLNIKSNQDIKMQGVDIASGGDTNIEAKGDVTMESAQNTEKTSNNGFNVGVELSIDTGNTKANSSMGLGVDVGFNTGSSKKKEAVTGSIDSGGNINIKSGNDMTLEGVDIASDGKTKIDAGGDVNLKAAESSEDKFQFGLSVGIDVTTGGGRKGEQLPDTKNLTGTAKAKQTVKNAIDDKKDGVKSAGVSPVGFGLDLEFKKAKEYDSTNINSANGIEINSGGKVTQEQSLGDAMLGGTTAGGMNGTVINAKEGVETNTKVGYDVGIDMNINAGKDATKEGIKEGK